MALDFDVSKVKNFEVVTTLIASDGSSHWHPVTQTLIWGTMAVDMGEITEANWREFYFRLNLWQRNVEPITVHLTTPFEVYAHIGLHTNVCTKSRKEWYKRYLSVLDDQFERHGNKDLEREVPIQYEKSRLATVSKGQYQELLRNGYHNEQQFTDIMLNPLWTNENITSCEIAD